VDLLTTTTALDERTRGSRVAVLPIGSCEQHGDYLPLITDTVIAAAIANEVSAANDLWLLPPLTISCSPEHAGWPGTVSLRAETLIKIVEDVAESARQNGADRLVIVNGHGGNYVLANIVQEANVAEPTMVLFPSRDDWDDVRQVAGLETNSREDMHGGELEVSVLLHVAPELVSEGVENSDHDAEFRPHLLTVGMRGYTRNGIIGRPSLATADKGAAIIEGLIKSFESHLRLLTHDC